MSEDEPKSTFEAQHDLPPTMIVLTDHAIQRAKERLGLPLKQLVKTAQIAFDRGLKHDECKGSLHKYVLKMIAPHGYGHDIRIHNRHLWVFVMHVKKLDGVKQNQRRLITIYPMPRNLHKLIDACTKANQA
jgi:hypothetical protein